MGTVTAANIGRPKRETPRRGRKQRHATSPIRGNPLALEDELLALARSVPREEWAKLPADLNENLDHYLYGSPRKPVMRKRSA
jgi:hypothetical protein